MLKLAELMDNVVERMETWQKVRCRFLDVLKGLKLIFEKRFTRFHVQFHSFPAVRTHLVDRPFFLPPDSRRRPDSASCNRNSRQTPYSNSRTCPRKVYKL